MKFIKLTVLSVVAILCVACTVQVDPIAPAEQETPIGVVLPMTGNSTFGNPTLEGIQLAINEINRIQLSNTQIKLIIRDSESSPENAAALFSQLIDDENVMAIIGPGLSSSTGEAFPVAQEKSVVAIAPVSTAAGLSEIGDFVFRTSIPVNVATRGLVVISQEKLGYQEVATLYASDELFSQNSNDVVMGTLGELGVSVLLEESFTSDETDLTTQLTQIRDANPDAILISALSSTAVDIVLQARAMGIPETIPLIVGTTVTSEQIEQMGDAAEGLISRASWSMLAETPSNQAFVQNYKAEYGNDPSAFSALGYAAAHILTSAMANAETLDSTGLQGAMAGIVELDTILGQFSFDPTGDPIYDPAVLIVEQGQLEFLR